MALELPTQERIDDYNARRGRAVVDAAYSHDRQRAMDARASQQVGGDGEGFWQSVKNVLSGAGYGAASAADEMAETGQAAMREGTPEAVTEGAERMGERMGGIAEELGVELPEEAPPSEEVTALRDAFGVEPPSSAEGEAAAGLAQFLTGMGLAVATGGAGALARGVSAVAKPAIAKAAPKLAQSRAAQTIGAGAMGGQAAGAISDYAAFDALEKRMLVAMNEIPALDRFIPDMLASHDPDAPEWQLRFERMVEGGALGGVVGASAGAVWSGIRAYVHGVRAGRPGKVLDSPTKAGVEDAASQAALRAQVEGVEQMHAADAWARPRPKVSPQQAWMAPIKAMPYFDNAVEAGTVTGDQRNADMRAWIKARKKVDTDTLNELADKYGVPKPEGRAARTPQAEPAEAPQGLSVDEMEAVGTPAQLAEQLASRGRILTREWEHQGDPEAFDLARTTDLGAALWGATTDTGLREVASPKLGLAERAAMDRVRDASVAPGDTARAALAEQAMTGWRRTFAEEWDGAKGKGWLPQGERPGMQGAPEPVEAPAARFTDEASGNEWLASQKVAMRDVGRLSPDLDDAAAPPAPATLRAEAVSTAAARQPAGEYEGDVFLASQRPEAMPSVTLPGTTRGVLQHSLGDAVERPVDVHFDAIHTVEDFGRLTEAVTAHRGIDMGLEHTQEIHALRQGTEAREAAIREAQAREEELSSALADPQALDRRALGDERRAVRDELKVLRDTQKQEREHLAKLAADREANEQAFGKAREAAEELLFESGYRYKLRADLDGRTALHVVEAVTGSMQRIATSAAADGVSSSQRAAALRAMHKADAVMEWLQGNDRAAGRALKRGALEVEEGGLMFPLKADPKDTRLGTEVARRWRDKGLVSQSGGTRRVQARFAALSGAEDAGQVLHQMKKFRDEARYAWSGWERAGLHNTFDAAMMVRMGGMLSRPGTWTMNLTSNALFAGLRVPERFLSEAFAVRERGMGGALSNALAETGDMVMAVSAGMRDGITLARHEANVSFRSGSEAVQRESLARLREKNMAMVYDDAQRLDQFEHYHKASVAGVPEVLKETLADTRLAGYADWMASKGLSAENLLTHGISVQKVGDMMFKGLTYRMELNRLAARQVRASLGPRTPANAAAWDRAVEHRIASPDAGMYRDAMQSAHIATFTAESVGGVENYVKAMKRYPALRLVTPFVRTPANVMVEATKRLPLIGAFALKTERAAWRAGGEARRDLLARQTMGAAMAASVYGLMQNGRFSGSPPRNEQLARAWRATGKKEYSVKLGDAWVDYRQLFGFHGLGMVATADAMEMLAAAETAEEHEQASLAVHAAKGIGAFFFDATFLGGFGELIELAGGSPGAETVGRYVRRQAESFLPLNANLRAMQRQFADRGFVSDPTARGGAGGKDEGIGEKMAEEWDAFANTLKDRFHFLGSGADRYPRRDHRGHAVSYQTGGPALGVGDLVLGYAGPAAYSYQATDALSVAENELEYNPGWAPSRITVAYGEGSGLAKVLELDRAQYDWLSKRAGELYERDAEALLKTAQWRDMVDGERRDALASVTAATRRQARGELVARDGGLRKRMDDAMGLLELKYDDQRRQRRQANAMAGAP